MIHPLRAARVGHNRWVGLDVRLGLQLLGPVHKHAKIVQPNHNVLDLKAVRRVDDRVDVLKHRGHQQAVAQLDVVVRLWRECSQLAAGHGNDPLKLVVDARLADDDVVIEVAAVDDLAVVAVALELLLVSIVGQQRRGG